MDGNQYVDLIRQVLAERNVALDNDVVERMAWFAKEAKVPMRVDSMKNFVAAYLRVVLGWSARDANKVASSSRGRRTWEDKILIVLIKCLAKCKDLCSSKISPVARLLLGRGTEFLECILSCMERDCGIKTTWF